MSPGRIAALTGAIVVVVGVILFALNLHWVAVHIGATSTLTGPWYNFWSGFGSDLGEATLIATVIASVGAGFRKINCHEPGCWRIGHYPLAGTPHHLCARHHPEFENTKVTHEGIMRRHEAAKAAAAKKASRPSRPSG